MTSSALLPEYVSKAEVQRVCAELEIQDWTAITTVAVGIDEAQRIRAEIGNEALDIPVEEFRDGLQVELEHGLRFADANVTSNHPILTGLIVLAHLKEMLDYYARLRVAELEGDLFKEIIRGDADAIATIYCDVLAAREALSRWESKRMSSSSQ